MAGPSFVDPLNQCWAGSRYKSIGDTDTFVSHRDRQKTFLEYRVSVTPIMAIPIHP